MKLNTLLKSIIALLFLSLTLQAQVTKSDIRDLLVLQGFSDLAEIEAQTSVIYDSYLDKISYNFGDLLAGVGYSALSGVSLGAHEAHQFGYKKIDWMPKFMQDWYKSSDRALPQSVFGDFFNWREVFKQFDYVADRNAYESLNTFFKQKWYFSLVTHWVVKNTFATIMRDQMKHEQPFYSWKIDFVMALPK
ncbi:MAG: hypothetical protein JEY94_04105 [Melioribacteraceae bacterium]|nr:hypothetical protein [Melioribacteraceae bacterium]